MVMMMIGSTMIEIVSPPAMRLLPSTIRAGDLPEELHEDRESRDPVHDRWHAGEIADVRVEPGDLVSRAYSSR